MKRAKIVLIVGFFVSVIVFSMVFFVYKSNNKISQEVEEENMQEELQEIRQEKTEEEMMREIRLAEKRKGTNKREVSEEIEDTREKVTLGNGEEVVVEANANRIEMTSREVKKVKSEAENLIYNFNFARAHDFLYGESLKYKEETIPEDIKIMIEETALMSSFDMSLMQEETTWGILDTIRGFKNEDNFLASILYLEHKQRKYIIESVDSVNPIFVERKIDVLKKEDVTNEFDRNKLDTLYQKEKDAIDKIYKHTFLIEGNKLESYIVNIDGKLKFISMEQVTSNGAKYYTIKEGMELFNE